MRRSSTEKFFMNDKMCFTCKQLGKIRLAEGTDTIYAKGRGENTRIHHCYSHQVEFFKIGQTNFLLKYNAEFIGYEFFTEATSRTHDHYPFSSF